MKLIAEFEKVLTPSDEKKNVFLSFNVEEDFSFLRITCFYSPKKLENFEMAKQLVVSNLRRDGGNKKDEEAWEEFLPLLNLVTLSVDDPDSYRGACHRQAQKQVLILGEEEASPGLIKGKIKKGKWRAVLNVHALVTESCVYELKIEGGEENEG